MFDFDQERKYVQQSLIIDDILIVQYESPSSLKKHTFGFALYKTVAGE